MIEPGITGCGMLSLCEAMNCSITAVPLSLMRIDSAMRRSLALVGGRGIFLKVMA